MKKYPAYKPSGIDWLGDIPEGWVVKKIKYLAEGDDSIFTDGDWIESDNIVLDKCQIRYITTGNIGKGKYKEQGSSYITEETFKKLNCTEIFTGDLLISRLNPPLGRCCIVPDLKTRIVTSVDNVVLRPHETYIKRFLLYAMSNTKYFEFTALIARGATMQRISRGLLGNVPLAIGTKTEQKQIAAFLDKKTAQIDTLIEKKQKMMELLKEKRSAIINHAVTKGLNPNAKMKDSGIEWLGDIPEHWDIFKIAHLSDKITNGYVGPTRNILVDKGAKYIQSLHIKKGTIDFHKPYYVTQEWSEKHKRSELKKDDLLIVQTGAIGEVAIVPASFEGANCHALILLQTKPKYDSKFIFRSLTSHYGNNKLLSVKTGALHPHLNSTYVKDIKLCVPPYAEQQQNASFLDKKTAQIDNFVEITNKQIALLKEYRTALISEVVTGKIDVTDEVTA